MSRGLGKIERAILEALEKDATDLSEQDRESGIERGIPLMDTRKMFAVIHGGFMTETPWAKYNAITRALRSLARKELVASIKHEGRTLWTDRQGAYDLDELEKEARRDLAHLQKRMELGR